MFFSRITFWCYTSFSFPSTFGSHGKVFLLPWPPQLSIFRRLHVLDVMSSEVRLLACWYFWFPFFYFIFYQWQLVKKRAWHSPNITLLHLKWLWLVSNTIGSMSGCHKQAEWHLVKCSFTFPLLCALCAAYHDSSPRGRWFNCKETSVSERTPPQGPLLSSWWHFHLTHRQHSCNENPSESNLLK